MKYCLPILVFLVVIVGCSDAAPEVTIEMPALPTVAVPAVATPSLVPAANDSMSPAVQVSPSVDTVVATIEPKPTAESADNQTLDIDTLFAAPKHAQVIKEPERVPEKQAILPELPKRQVGPPPAMRLIGFSEMDELKALVAIEGKLNILGLGQSAEGVELVDLQPPVVTLKHGETEIKIALNEQPWVTVPGSGGDGSGIGAGVQLPNKPSPVTLPGNKKLPTPPTSPRLPNQPSPTASPAKTSTVGHQFPAANPPPLPPPPMR